MLSPMFKKKNSTSAILGILVISLLQKSKDMGNHEEIKIKKNIQIVSLQKFRQNIKDQKL